MTEELPRLYLSIASAAEINAAVAEYCGGWEYDTTDEYFDKVRHKSWVAGRGVCCAKGTPKLVAFQWMDGVDTSRNLLPPDYLKDANAVHELFKEWEVEALRNCDFTPADRPHLRWTVCIYDEKSRPLEPNGEAQDTSFCRAACLALLRASHRVEVVG